MPTETGAGRVSCLGPQGSYSSLAAYRMCPESEIVLCPTFRETVELLLRGETKSAVLPVENSLNGGVVECLDLLGSEEIFGVEERVLLIDHRFARLEGTREEDIVRIYSHEQALAQCAGFLSRRFPGAKYITTSSTAESLNRLDADSAGIVGAHVRRTGVVLSPENIADNKGNYTRFLRCVRRGELPARGEKLFFCATCPHEPGALAALLSAFGELNLTRIESRPVKETPGEYRFFIEIVCNVGEGRVQKALSEAKRRCTQFKILGVY